MAESLETKITHIETLFDKFWGDKKPLRERDQERVLKAAKEINFSFLTSAYSAEKELMAYSVTTVILPALGLRNKKIEDMYIKARDKHRDSSAFDQNYE